MQINSSNQYNISSKGMTGLLKKHPFLYAEETALGLNNKKLIGTIPQDFLKLLNGKDVKQSFLSIDKGISDSCDSLNAFEKYINSKIRDYLGNLSFLKFLKFTVEQVKYITKGNSLYNKNFILESINLDKEVIKSTEKDLCENIKNGMINAKLIKKDDNVKVKLVDFGGFGTVYRLSCTDSSKKKIFSDKAIKFYRDRNDKDSLNTEIEMLTYNMINNHKLTCSLFSKMLKMLFVKFGILDEKIFNALVRDKIRLVKNSTPIEYRSYISEAIKKKTQNVYKHYHGLYREANIALFIKKAIGHRIKNSDAVEFHFANPQSQYAVFEFADIESLGKVRKHNKLEDLGIETKDNRFNNQDKNLVAGRLIDYGDFKPINKTLTASKLARRYYKKISNANGKGEAKILKQIKLLMNYYKLARSNKLANSDQVLCGLDEAVKLLPESLRIFFKEEF